MDQNIKFTATIFLLCFAFCMSCLAQSSINSVHEVQKGETLYSLSKLYNVSISEILSVNPELSERSKKLKKGYLLNIPRAANSNQNETTALPPNEAFKLAVILPFTANSTISERVIEFYRGVLLATNAAKEAGYNIEISAFNEPAQKENMESVLGELQNAQFDFIIGPLYPTHFNELCLYANQNKQRIVIPFSSKVAQINSNPYLYLLNTPSALGHQKAIQLFKSSFKPSRVIIVRTAKADKQEFTNELMQHLLSEKYEIQTLPSTFFAEDLKRVLTTKLNNVFVFDGSDWDETYKMLQTIADFKSSNPNYKISTVGHNEWQNCAMENADILHDTNAFILASDYYNAYNTAVIDFEETYKRWFNKYPIIYHPRMGELGYDCGLFMLNALALHGNNFNEQEVNANYLQTNLKFEKVASDGGYANVSLMFIHYTQDSKIECIELK